MNIDILQWVGYVASVIIAVSMTMSSIVKFRWINLAGASTFSVYGFLIGAYPVGVLNLFIVSVDVFYLLRIYSKKELFRTLELRSDNKYLLSFLDFHRKEIHAFFPDFTYKPEMNSISFFVLRDMAVAGVFLAHKEDNNILKVGLDYVVPAYRDYKNGKFIYEHLGAKFRESGFEKVIVEAKSKKYIKYLKRLGFIEKPDGMYEKSLDAVYL